MHRAFGGVVPELASRDHVKYLVPLVDEALQQAGKPVRLLRAEGYNHFEIAETLASPFAAAGRAALAMMALGDA